MSLKIKFSIISFLLFSFSLASAQFLVLDQEMLGNPTIYPWCYEATEKDNACYDGISYAYLIEKGVAKEDYPVTKADFLLIQDSFQ